MEINLKKGPTLEDAWSHYENVKDQSHGTNHIKAVLSNALAIVKAHPTEFEHINKDDVTYAAVLHDIGHKSGIDNQHHVLGVQIAKPFIAKLPEASQSAILDAVQHHHGETLPSTVVGQIVRDADRLASTSNIDNFLMRGYQYRKEHHPELTQDEIARDAYHYLRHNKLKRLDSRAESAFLTEEGKNMFKENVGNIERSTHSFADYARELNKCLGKDEVNVDYKLASFREDYRVPALTENGSQMRDKAYIQSNKDLLANHKWNKNMQSILKKEISQATAESSAKTQLEKSEADTLKFDREMQQRKLSLEEKKVNAEIRNKNEELKLKQMEPKTKSKSKTAKIAAFVNIVRDESPEGYTTVNIPHDTNFYQDSKEIILGMGKNDGLQGARRKALAGAAAAITGVATLGGVYHQFSKIPSVVADIDKVSWTGAIPVAGIAAGLGGAFIHRNDESKLKRNVGLGVAAASLLGVDIMQKGYANSPVTTALARKYAVPVMAGTALTLGGLGALGHYNQHIKNEYTIKDTLTSDEPYTDVVKRVNSIRGGGSIVERYPIIKYLPYLDKVPFASKIMNTRIGTPAEQLEDKDRAFYFETQVNKEYDNLVKVYTVLKGNPSEKILLKLRSTAEKMVLDKMKNKV